MPQAWGEVLGVIGDQAELLRLYALVLRLPREVEAQLDEVDKGRYPVDMALWCLLPITNAFKVELASNNQISAFAAHYDGEAFAYLELSDDILHWSRAGMIPSTWSASGPRSPTSKLT
jgi:hypothetical protein